MSGQHGLTMVKLGGSVITDKRGREQARPGEIDRLAGEVARFALSTAVPIVVAHGSGSFAHVAVAESGFLDRPADPMAWAAVAASARRLNVHVVDALLAAGLPAFGVPAATFIVLRDGELAAVDANAVVRALRRGLVPVVYGDVVPDEVRGGAVACTEVVMAALAHELRPKRIVLASDVDGVYQRYPPRPDDRPIPRIAPEDAEAVLPGLRSVADDVVDVTGGMAGKVAAMLTLVARQPWLEVVVVSGMRPESVYEALMAPRPTGGTLLAAAET